jgi:nucleoside-diphosphate-sugar epimerase
VSRVLVTGASGFIGRQALAPLQELGYEVHGVSRSEQPDAAGIHWHREDLLEPGAVPSLIDTVRPERLLHLAWFAVPGEFWTSPENRRWVEVSNELLRSFAEAGGERAVVAGSCTEYDWSGDGVLDERSSPMHPGTPYGQAKLDLSRSAAELAAQTGISVGWGRIFFLFGPEEHPDRLVASVARSILVNEPAACTDGTQERDFLYVADTADSLVALLHSSVEGPVNLGSGVPTKVSSLVEMVAESAGAPELLRLGELPMREGDPPLVVADNTRLREEVGWDRVTPLEEAVDRTVSWWREQLDGGP